MAKLWESKLAFQKGRRRNQNLSMAIVFQVPHFWKGSCSSFWKCFWGVQLVRLQILRLISRLVMDLCSSNITFSHRPCFFSGSKWTTNSRNQLVHIIVAWFNKHLPAPIWPSKFTPNLQVFFSGFQWMTSFPRLENHHYSSPSDEKWINTLEN